MSGNGSSSAGNVTVELKKLVDGDTSAAERLLPLIYNELRTLAAWQLCHERPNHTLSPTALVHEVFLRLFTNQGNIPCANRQHFFRIAARAMRQILVNSALAKKSAKRRGTVQLTHEAQELVPGKPFDLDLVLDLDHCLTQLEQEDTEVAELVKLRLYAGLSTTEAAGVLGISRSKAFDDWLFAKVWFAEKMKDRE